MANTSENTKPTHLNMQACLGESSWIASEDKSAFNKECDSVKYLFWGNSQKQHSTLLVTEGGEMQHARG